MYNGMTLTQIQGQGLRVNIFGILFNQNKCKIKHIFADVCW